MKLSPDEHVLWQYGFIHLNMTIVMTWAIMAVLVISAMLITRRLSTGRKVSRWQNVLEMIVLTIIAQLEEVGLDKPRRYMGFIGTLFLFIILSNLCSIIPWYEPPTGSLSTTTALALSVFVAVPVFGIREKGVGSYLRSYIEPNAIMLPFNIIGEISRTLSLAVRLFGNIMSGGLVVGILLGIAPFIFPMVMHALELLTGAVQAYIFSILAAVYITAATQSVAESQLKS